MADFLIQHLKEKAKEHSALEMLVNQWGFDEKLIPKALQTVGNLFPHYSRHDESHSKQILINIERLLGKENIAKLTATDTWLLLEAAYWHDIGMVVPQNHIKEAFNHPDFPQYIQQIRNTPHHELHRFSLHFNSSDISQCFAGADTPIEAMDKFRQLMAEWFRRQHATRASKIIQAPWESAGISSPRTELIPARLFKLLGRVCHMHGLAFKELLAPNGLPYREAGLAQEDCHPRFVACLLRMGDLLDLDDNRFCPVMQRISGDNRSLLSKAHEDKHAGMRHLRVDPERIEITAECETIDGYLETFKWFDWLKQEMQDQMSHWQDIVPSREFGLLPTLGNIAVRLSGEQQILQEGQRPQFSIDGKQAIKLLQGDNLYSSHFACIRELLQNAVDATLLRLWLEHEKVEESEIWKSPFSKRAKEILASHSVEIRLEEQPVDADTPDDKSCWQLTIIDQGTGISREDLNYMLRIRGSQSNLFRQTKINDMPEWMKPSGDFGIGFQSVFLICDVVKLTSKSIFTNEILEITMHNPSGDKEGLVIFKPLENDISRPYGTTIEFNFLLEKVSRRYSISIGESTSFKMQFLNSYDPILDESLALEAAQLGDEIQKFAEYAPLKICPKLTTIRKNFPFKEVVNNEIKESSLLQGWYFVEVKGYQVALQCQLALSTYPDAVKALYRGQPFKQDCIRLPNVSVLINLLSGKAGKWLTANREKLVASAEDEFIEVVLAAFEKLVAEDLNSNSMKSEKKPLYSFFLESMALHYDNQWRELAKRFEGAWLNLKTSDGTKAYSDLFQLDSWKIGYDPLQSNERIPTECDFLINQNYSLYNLDTILINEWLKSENNSIQVIEDKELYKVGNYTLVYQLKKGFQHLYSKEALAIRLINSRQQFHQNQRFLLNFEDGWNDLHFNELYLKGGFKIRASYLFDIPQRDSKIILLPFLFCDVNKVNPSVKATSEQLDGLCKWVQQHSETEASLPDIRKAYDRLISYIDNEIMKPSPHCEEWEKARGLLN